MKKIYLACCFSFFIASSFAQFQPGQIVLGGNIGFATNGYKVPASNSKSYRYSLAFFNPMFGKFIKPNLLLGIGLSYEYTAQKYFYADSIDTYRNHTHSIGANLFSQRFFSLAPKLFFTLTSGLSASYIFGKYEYLPVSTLTSSSSRGLNANVSLAPGLSYKLSERFLFDAFLSNLVNISYSNNKIRYANSLLNQETNNFNLSSSLSNTSLGSVGLGFRWLLKNKVPTGGEDK